MNECQPAALFTQHGNPKSETFNCYYIELPFSMSQPFFLQNLANIQIYKLRHPSSSRSIQSPTSISSISPPCKGPSDAGKSWNTLREDEGQRKWDDMWINLGSQVFPEKKGNDACVYEKEGIVVFRNQYIGTIWLRMNQGIFLLQNCEVIQASVPILIEPKVPVVPIEHGPLRDESPLQQAVIFKWTMIGGELRLDQSKMSNCFVHPIVGRWFIVVV